MEASFRSRGQEQEMNLSSKREKLKANPPNRDHDAGVYLGKLREKKTWKIGRGRWTMAPGKEEWSSSKEGQILKKKRGRTGRVKGLKKIYYKPGLLFFVKKMLERQEG